MVIEMSHHSRNVRIAALAKRFAIVHAFQNSDQALMLLDVARNAVQSPRWIMLYSTHNRTLQFAKRETLHASVKNA